MKDKVVYKSIPTKRLVLRQINPDDAPKVFAYRADPDVAKYQRWNPKSIEDVRAFLEELALVVPNSPGTWLQLAIVHRDDDQLIGDCGIRFPKDDLHQVELGITIAPSYQGKGMASEVMLAILEYVFITLKKHRAFASIDPRNHDAIALVGHIGMRQEAHFRESLLIDGKWVDDVVYAILESEWHARKS